ncbi:toll/interleukin-1 receptor domain-containing protein [Hahella sp. CR1]|uniref:toll/interleukin-1 receptor domain-containing protein n=1 Tax=Hahella sp. CR1 TaxID=2992807 RepID=UPI0024426994|nr:toll/interleukin-1 receptor domain-containing protein [Hahella sp. CR1]MDG9671841.1 toll/interleukin-1 receptor domain-containing protein [Hahella sp. CR1]
MNVFISWSGEKSKAVAVLLRSWLRYVLQALDPWVSDVDIERGEVWFNAIGKKIKDSTVGVICLTKENVNKPWILFEAGALSRGLESQRVCTFLVDLSPSDVSNPLASFNHSMPDENGLYRLIFTLNESLGSEGLDVPVLDVVYKQFWPLFESKFKEIILKYPNSDVKSERSAEDMLAEILESIRPLGRSVRRQTLADIGNKVDDDMLSSLDGVNRVFATMFVKNESRKNSLFSREGGRDRKYIEDAVNDVLKKIDDESNE